MKTIKTSSFMRLCNRQHGWLNYRKVVPTFSSRTEKLERQAAISKYSLERFSPLLEN
jgi:hypothetical protein